MIFRCLTVPLVCKSENLQEQIPHLLLLVSAALAWIVVAAAVGVALAWIVAVAAVSAALAWIVVVAAVGVALA